MTTQRYRTHDRPISRVVDVDPGEKLRNRRLIGQFFGPRVIAERENDVLNIYLVGDDSALSGVFDHAGAGRPSNSDLNKANADFWERERERSRS